MPRPTSTSYHKQAEKLRQLSTSTPLSAYLENIKWIWQNRIFFFSMKSLWLDVAGRFNAIYVNCWIVRVVVVDDKRTNRMTNRASVKETLELIKRIKSALLGEQSCRCRPNKNRRPIRNSSSIYIIRAERFTLHREWTLVCSIFCVVACLPTCRRNSLAKLTYLRNLFFVLKSWAIFASASKCFFFRLLQLQRK